MRRAPRPEISNAPEALLTEKNIGWLISSLGEIFGRNVYASSFLAPSGRLTVCLSYGVQIVQPVQGAAEVVVLRGDIVEMRSERKRLLRDVAHEAAMVLAHRIRSAVLYGEKPPTGEIDFAPADRMPVEESAYPYQFAEEASGESDLDWLR